MSIHDGPRTNGLYRGIVPHDLSRDAQSEYYWPYLRFYPPPNCRVLAVTSSGTPEQISVWFTEEGAQKTYFSIGTYSVSGTCLTFTTQGSLSNDDPRDGPFEDRVEYEISIEDDGATFLTAKWYSHINGNSGVERYEFVG